MKSQQTEKKSSNSGGMKGLAGISFALLITFFLSACTGSKVIKEAGLSYAKIGSDMPEVGMKKIKGHPVRDTMIHENDYSWRVAMLDYPNGQVWLEGDFFEKETLNRIHIQTSDLKTKSGIRVGDTVGDLLEITGSWYVNPMPRFQKFDFYSELIPRIHFVVDEPGLDMSKEGWENYPIANFNKSAKIVGIVVY